MTRTPPLKCTLCERPLWNHVDTQPFAIWSPGPNRLPFCGEECMGLANAVDRSIPAPVDRAIRRDHSLCGVEPCSDCR